MHTLLETLLGQLGHTSSPAMAGLAPGLASNNGNLLSLRRI
jgi:hypothetical protein